MQEIPGVLSPRTKNLKVLKADYWGDWDNLLLIESVIRFGSKLQELTLLEICHLLSIISSSNNIKLKRS
jgi:hypothetical protein